MSERTERYIEDRGEVITAAAHVLIGMVRTSERAEGGRSTHGELELTVELVGGGVETWVIRIERTASSH
jgi:hypothetical protein